MDGQMIGLSMSAWLLGFPGVVMGGLSGFLSGLGGLWSLVGRWGWGGSMRRGVSGVRYQVWVE